MNVFGHLVLNGNDNSKEEKEFGAHHNKWTTICPLLNELYELGVRNGEKGVSNKDMEMKGELTVVYIRAKMRQKKTSVNLAHNVRHQRLVNHKVCTPKNRHRG